MLKEVEGTDIASDSVVDYGDINVEANSTNQNRLFSFIFRNKNVPVPTQEERRVYPRSKANMLSKIFVMWLLPLISVGYRRTLQREDLYLLSDDLKVDTYFDQIKLEIHKKIEQNREKLQEKGEEFQDEEVLLAMALFWIFLKVYKQSAIRAVGYSIIALSGAGVTPFVSKKLIAFVSLRALGVPEPIGKGIGYAFGTAGLVVVNGIFSHHATYSSQEFGMKAANMLTHLIVDKSFKLSRKSKALHDDGHITSVLTTDMTRIRLGFEFIPILIASPSVFILALVVLIVNIGPTVLISIGMFLGLLVCLGLAGIKMLSLRKETARRTDIRVGITKEITQSLRMIKFYTWERPYFAKIMKARFNEVKVVQQLQILKNAITSFAVSLVGIATMFTFLILYAIDGKLKSPAKIFSSLLSLELFALFVYFIPLAGAQAADVLLGFGRSAAIISAEEVEPSLSYHNINDPSNNTAVLIENGNFEWEVYKKEAIFDEKKKKKEEKKKKKSQDKEASSDSEKKDDPDDKTKYKVTTSLSFKLSDINLHVKKNEFVVITGPIGSGKSSLLEAIAGSLPNKTGDITINGSLLHLGHPWIKNSTVRDNIVFGQAFDKEKYESVISACCLTPDLASFSGGDLTEVGDRGITLSGGQKARISLARAVYADSDILLMDDVLSAVDATVGHHIVDNLFFDYLKTKTKILATHQLSLISSADKIVFLNGDGTMHAGTLEELQLIEEFNLLWKSQKKTNKKEKDEEADKKPRDDVMHLPLDGKLAAEEEKAVNAIPLEVVLKYVESGAGKLTAIGFLLLFGSVLTLATFVEIFSTTWLSFWVEYKFKGRGDHFYIWVYIMITFSWVILVMMEFTLLAALCANASKQLNILAMKKVLYAPMRFLDSTPIGRIMNRFTKDTDSLDNEIGEQIILTCYTGAKIIGMIILDIIYIPWIALLTPVLFVLIVVSGSFYRASCREVKRLEAVMNSDLFNNHSEVLGGSQTIKAFGKQQMFVQYDLDNINKVAGASILVIATKTWMTISLVVAVGFLTLLVSLLSINRVFNINASSVGLIITYTIQLSNTLNLFFEFFTDTENTMNSVERLYQYAFRVPQEEVKTQQTIEYSEKVSRENWPTQASISFQHVYLSYRPGLPAILKDLSFDVAAGERIGICGRTGAGKSSIMTALYRLVELSGGKILIDGVDISKLDLETLRSQLTIIPQDPVLFNGTIRSNLDPFGDYTDDQLWDVVRRSGMVTEEEMNKEGEKPKFHLDQEVLDEGRNFSLGERQLIAFARAMIRNTKILILDEATSSVDYNTDMKVQRIINNEFKHCTIMCIAHRLNTIVHYDRIMTLDKGDIREFDKPITLFNNGSLFRSMCDKSGITSESFSKEWDEKGEIEVEEDESSGSSL